MKLERSQREQAVRLIGDSGNNMKAESSMKYPHASRAWRKWEWHTSLGREVNTSILDKQVVLGGWGRREKKASDSQGRTQESSRGRADNHLDSLRYLQTLFSYLHVLSCVWPSFFFLCPHPWGISSKEKTAVIRPWELDQASKVTPLFHSPSEPICDPM